MTNDERVRFTLRMPYCLYELLKEKAQAKGFTTNALLVEIAWAHLKKREG